MRLVLFFTMDERTARGEGISPALIRKPGEITGIEKVFPLERFPLYLSWASLRAKAIYTSFKPEELMKSSFPRKVWDAVRDHDLESLGDGRATRELQFVKILKERFPQNEIKDCSPFLWEMRAVKSPAEIEVLRRRAASGSRPPSRR